jgi:hypothetical protein
VFVEDTVRSCVPRFIGRMEQIIEAIGAQWHVGRLAFLSPNGVVAVAYSWCDLPDCQQIPCSMIQ